MSQNVEQQDSEHPVGPEFDPLDPDYLADPYPYYARFRREAPVFYAPKHLVPGPEEALGGVYAGRVDET